MTSNRQSREATGSGDLATSDQALDQLHAPSVNQNFQEALQELLREGTLADFEDSWSAPPDMDENPMFLSPSRAAQPGQLSPHSHFSESYDNFSEHTTPGFGDDSSELALSSMLSLQENTLVVTSDESLVDTEAVSRSTSKEQASSLGDSVTHPSTRLLSPILTNTPSPSSQPLNAFSRSSTANGFSTERSNQAAQSMYRDHGTGKNAAANIMHSSAGARYLQNLQSTLRHGQSIATSGHSESQSARRGVQPEARGKMNESHVPSLEDQDKKRQLAQTKAGVEQWLTTTDINEMSSPNTEFKDMAGGSRADLDQNSISITSVMGKVAASEIDGTASTPGPGVYVREDEEEDEDEDEEDEENVFGDHESPTDEYRVVDRNLFETHGLQYENVNDYTSTDEEGDTTPPAVPASRSLQQTPTDVSAGQERAWGQRPWADPLFDSGSASVRGQPSSSNAAIARFERRAKDIETASRTATIASSFRRRSLESLFSSANISVVAPNDGDRNQTSDGSKDKKHGLFDRILPKRSNSNLRKRKESREGDQSLQEVSAKPDVHASTVPIPKVPNWARPKSPSLGAYNAPHYSPPPAKNSTSLAPSSGPWTSVTNVIKRARSKSDLAHPHPSALAEQWASQGGPPVANLRPSEEAVEQADHIFELQQPKAVDQRDSDLDVDQDGEHTPTGLVDMSMRALATPSAPTSEAFKIHASNANPHIEPYMLERVTSEQLKRCRRLVEARLKHENHVKKKNCPSRGFCPALGGGPKVLKPRKAGPDSDGPAVTFFISRTGFSGEASAAAEDDSIPASFPEGIPSPPAGVNKLPAEFECPLCFQVKKIFKPSDWTKHVHEDLQPFTCSFPDCGEPKSFKRKADWVRHENERHRQLEKWICSFPDCHHTCYRKDNFVQHLVREHKLPEPRLRASKATGRNGRNANSEQNEVPCLIEICKHDTPRRPDEEACRFCGNYLTTWKKLSAHLAKHMEQISLPVLSLVQQVDISSEKVVSPSEYENIHSRQESIETNAGYSVSPPQGLQSQPFPNYPPPATMGAMYQNSNYVIDESQDEGRMSRSVGAPFPGTKDLPRETYPYGHHGLAGDSSLLVGDSLSTTEQEQLFGTTQTAFGEVMNSSSFAQAPGNVSTFPPSFISTASSQRNVASGFQQGPLYQDRSVYTDAPNYDAAFPPDNYSSPPGSVQSVQHYPQRGFHGSSAPYSEANLSPYIQQTSRSETEPQYHYPHMASSNYTAQTTHAYPQLHQSHNENQPSNGGVGNMYMSSSPPQISQYYMNFNDPSYGLQQDEDGRTTQQQGSHQVHQQQPHHRGYY